MFSKPKTVVSCGSRQHNPIHDLRQLSMQAFPFPFRVRVCFHFSASAGPLWKRSQRLVGEQIMLVIRTPYSLWTREGSCTGRYHSTLLNMKVLMVLDKECWVKESATDWYLKCQFPNCSLQCCIMCADSLDSCRGCALPFCHSHRFSHECEGKDSQVPTCPSCASGKQLLGNDHSCERCARAQCTNLQCATSINTCAICNRDVCYFCEGGSLFRTCELVTCDDCVLNERRKRMPALPADDGMKLKRKRSL